MGTIIIIILAYCVLPQAIDALGPQAGEQSECRPTGIKGDPDKRITGDPDLTSRPNAGVVKIIRLTNDGLFVNRCELTDVLYELNWEVPKPYGPERKPNAVDLPRLTLMYVHGWKHGASQEDSDLIAFTKLIQSLQKNYEGKKQLLGVYVSWNASNGLGMLDNLSFWSKKGIADRISQSGVVTKIIATIGAMRKANQERLDQFIAIGHSFGARVVFAATNQPFIAEAARAHPGAPMGQYRPFAGSADSVILLNPAFEASLYTALDSFCREQELFPADQAPLLVSISTDNDWATGQAFPIGQWLGMNRGEIVTTTLGNFEQYRTHSLFRASTQNCRGSDTQPPALTERFAAFGLCLQRDRLPADAMKRKAHCTHNPFLVAATTHHVIDGHNGIWNENFSGWMFALITALEATHQQRIKSRAEGTLRN